VFGCSAAASPGLLSPPAAIFPTSVRGAIDALRLPGWRWDKQIVDLGPPPDLQARALMWMEGVQWTRRWPDYEREYVE
jgi:hypothetical protein